MCFLVNQYGPDAKWWQPSQNRLWRESQEKEGENNIIGGKGTRHLFNTLVINSRDMS